MSATSLPDDLVAQLVGLCRPQAYAAIDLLLDGLKRDERSFGDDPEFIGIKQAAKIAGKRDRETMKTWATKFGIGHKTDPTKKNSCWVFDKRKLLAVLEAKNSAPTP